ncbi:transmembrane anterior posterior transformation protein 1 homolog [Haliotis rufescens]|uniref:transmembrane anterior posterior transformation protein 1 homolog n=1 Tax=Haliotis rufescens TaxID=6454 RepID=UPI00201EC92A|nr:transmembrane anterior posterior transformation protein 1 homolog [Haliotis rufescens]
MPEENEHTPPSGEQEEFEGHSPQPAGISVLKYVTSELTRGYLLERDESKYTERRERVYTFMKTPRELEKFCMYGFFQCLDAFLFIFTFLPLRILMALLRLFTHPCGIFTAGSKRYLESAHICDLLKGIILLVCIFVINYIDTSMMYHLVRGQSVIKLYVFYNMLDVCDRLFSGFGQDILDALFWTATEPRGKKREHVGVVPHLLLAIVYVLMHTMLILSQATVLNVAFNSHNKALLTIMMSNNFVEIKGSLFKRVDKNNLFQISCSDVKERFHYCILLGIVFIRNMAEFAWNPDHLVVILPDVVLVLLAEFVVDWVKHAFITKFNEISSDAYKEFTINLVQDMVTSRQKHAFTDHSDQVSRRMGFTPLPLACLLYKICSKSLRMTGAFGILTLIIFYFCLLTLKVFTSIVLLGHGSRLLSQQKTKLKKPGKSQEVDSQKIPNKERQYNKGFESSPTPDSSPSPEPDIVTPPVATTVASDMFSSSASVDCVKPADSPEPDDGLYDDCIDEADWTLSPPDNHVTLRQCRSDSSLFVKQRHTRSSDDGEKEEEIVIDEVKDDENEEVLVGAEEGNQSDNHQVVFDDITAPSEPETVVAVERSGNSESQMDNVDMSSPVDGLEEEKKYR